MRKNHRPLLLLSFIAIWVIACKTETTNDPLIEDKTVNKTIITGGSSSRYGADDSIDVNGDGTFDFKFLFGAVSGVTDTTFYGGACIKGDVLTYTQNLGTTPTVFTTVLNSGDKISPSSTIWSTLGFMAGTLETTNIGIAGSGDKLIGFRFNADDGTHYGWMKVNIPDNYISLTVVELAYHKTPDTEIEAGVK